MAVVDYVRGTMSAASGGSTAGVSATATAPSGTVSGDQMIVWIITRDKTTDWVPPSGWILRETVENTGSTSSGIVRVYTAKNGTDVAGTSWTWTSGTDTGSEKWVLSGLVLKGEAVGDYQVGDAQYRPASGTSTPSPSITTTGQTVLIGFAADRVTGGSTWTWPAGWTEQVDIVSDPGGTNAVSSSNAFYDASPAAAGTYSVDATSSVTGSHAYAGIYAFSVPTAPKMSTLVDDFSAPNTTKWAYGTRAIVTGGRLNLTSNSDAQGNIYSKFGFDLTESVLSIEAIQVYSGLYFRLSNNGNATPDNALSFDFTATNIQAWVRTAGTWANIANIAYNATNHRWLRFRHTGTTVFWETSPDGTTWTQLASNSPSFPLYSMFPLSGIGGGAAGSTVLLDNLNIVPLTANFVASPRSGDAPLAVQFTDTTTNSPTSWSWDFGDSTTSTVQNPLKTYNSPGTYNVTLTATNGAGSDGETKANYISVTGTANLNKVRAGSSTVVLRVGASSVSKAYLGTTQVYP